MAKILSEERVVEYSKDFKIRVVERKRPRIDIFPPRVRLMHTISCHNRQETKNAQQLSHATSIPTMAKADRGLAQLRIESAGLLP
jgi:hypothetical protein